METKKKLVRNTFLSGLYQFWSIIVLFGMMPFIISYTSIISYGIFILTKLILGFSGFLDEPIRTSIIKIVAENKAQNNYENINKVISTALIFFIFSGIILAFIFYFFREFIFSIMFNLGSVNPSEAYFSLNLISFMMVFIFSIRLLSGTLHGLQRFDLTTITNFVVSIGQTLSIIISLFFGYGIFSVLLLFCSWTLFGGVINLYFIRKEYSNIRFSYSFFNISFLKEIFYMGSGIFVIKFLGNLNLNLGKIVIPIVLGISYLTYYESSYRFQALPLALATLMTTAVMPASTEIFYQNNISKFKQLFMRSSRYFTNTICIVSVPILVLVEPFLQYWLGNEFKFVASVAQILVGYWIIHSFLGVAPSMLFSIGKIKFQVKYALFLTLMNICLLYLFLIYFNYGLEGIALSRSIPYIIGAPFFIYYSLNIFKIALKDYLKIVIMPPLISSLVSGIILYQTKLLFYPGNIFEVFLIGSIGVVFYILFFFIAFLSDKDKQDIYYIYNSVSNYRLWGRLR